MECPPFANFLQILINIRQLVPVFFALGPVGDAMRYFTSVKTLQKNVCGGGKEMKGLPTRNVVYGYTYIHSFISQPVLRQLLRFLKSESSRKDEIVLPLSNHSTVYFPYDHPVIVYVFFFVFLSLVFFHLSSLQ
jgi:hypothetical protein